MRLTKAIGILVKLRDGEDPVTGKIVRQECTCQSPDVVRALYTTIAALPEAEDDEEESAEAAHSKPRPTRAGKPWTKDEDTCLSAAFDEGRGVSELARLFDRSRSAIRLRLVKLGRLSAEDVMLGRSRRSPAAPVPAAAAG